MLANGGVTRKDSQRVAAYGDIDELNACLGLVRTEIAKEQVFQQRQEDRVLADARVTWLVQLDRSLELIQQELFDLGAELSNPDAEQTSQGIHIHAESITRLEHELDALNDSLAPLKSFILPGGGAVSAMVHLARTVCRRAEREIVRLASQESLRPEVLRYANRLSDYLFVIARACTQKLGKQEVLWEQRRSHRSAEKL